MPIRPEMKSKYPPRKEWLAIRQRILARSGNMCEFCGVRNRTLGYRNAKGEFISQERGRRALRDAGTTKFPVVIGCHPTPDGLTKIKLFEIVLTIAHLDHDPTNNADSNLKALCQRCHLRYDKEHHAMNAAETRRSRRAKPLFKEATNA